MSLARTFCLQVSRWCDGNAITWWSRPPTKCWQPEGPLVDIVNRDRSGTGRPCNAYQPRHENEFQSMLRFRIEIMGFFPPYCVAELSGQSALNQRSIGSLGHACLRRSLTLDSGPFQNPNHFFSLDSWLKPTFWPAHSEETNVSFDSPATSNRLCGPKALIIFALVVNFRD